MDKNTLCETIAKEIHRRCEEFEGFRFDYAG